MEEKGNEFDLRKYGAGGYSPSLKICLGKKLCWLGSTGDPRMVQVAWDNLYAS
jgi:hypothetical protein